MYFKTELEQLFLKGNELGDEGVSALLRGAKRSPKIAVLDLVDNKFTEKTEIIVSWICIHEDEDEELRRSHSTSTELLQPYGHDLCSLSLHFFAFHNSQDQLVDLIGGSPNLTNYRLTGNAITDVGASKLIQGMLPDKAAHLKEFSLPEKCSQSTFEALEQAMGVGKKKGKKGKKKK